MDEPDKHHCADVVSSVTDLRDAPLNALVEESTPQADSVIDRVLDLEANGLLTVASFNASI